jgi:catechol 2,3-dioxygenase-like lactoylglutathione lyase family enzyme
MPPRLTLSGVVLDAPDPRELAAFYRRLLGWEVIQDEPDWVKLGCSTSTSSSTISAPPAPTR